MIDPKLSHFSTDELMFLYLTLEDKRKALQSKLDDIDSMPPSITRVELWAHFSAQFDWCCQWITKVDEVQQMLTARDKHLTDN